MLEWDSKSKAMGGWRCETEQVVVVEAWNVSGNAEGEIGAG